MHTNEVVDDTETGQNTGEPDAGRRIIGTFYKQQWGGHKGAYAIAAGEESFDATHAVLLLSHADLIELEDCSEETDSIGRDHVSWHGPCSVHITDSICRFFDVYCLEDITEAALASAKDLIKPQPANEEFVTLAIKIKVRVAPGASVTEFIENLDYAVTSNTNGITVQGTEIVDVDPENPDNTAVMQSDEEKPYVIYLPTMPISGNKYWSRENRWVEFPQATRFTASERVLLDLPTAEGKDVQWGYASIAEQMYRNDVASDQFENAITFPMSVVVAEEDRPYVIYASGVAGMEKAFWSNTDGWVEFPQATTFTQVERDMLSLPVAEGSQAKWGEWETANAYYSNGIFAEEINSKMAVSMDGGVSYQPATEGVRIIYRDVLIDGEDARGEVHINATHEGLVTDIWVNGECDGPGTAPTDHNIGTSAMRLEDIVSRLVEENS